MFSSVQFSRSVMSDSATPWISASLSIINSWSLLKLMPIELVMPSSHLILCHPLLLLPPIPPSIRVFYFCITYLREKPRLEVHRSTSSVAWGNGVHSPCPITPCPITPCPITPCSMTRRVARMVTRWLWGGLVTWLADGILSMRHKQSREKSLHTDLLECCFGVCDAVTTVVSDSCNPVDCSLPGSFIHGILQARLLEWAALSFSRGSFRPRDGTCVSYTSCIGRQVLYH